MAATSTSLPQDWLLARPTRGDIAFAAHCAHLVYLWRDGNDVPIDLDALAALPPTSEKELAAPNWVSLKLACSAGRSVAERHGAVESGTVKGRIANFRAAQCRAEYSAGP